MVEGEILGALGGLDDEQLQDVIAEARALIESRGREREEQQLERRRILNELRVIGESLHWNMVNCGNCPKCGYRKDGSRNQKRPHGPYPFLYVPSARTPTGYTTRYVAKHELSTVKRRIAEKKLRAELARQEIEEIKSGKWEPDADTERAEDVWVPGEATGKTMPRVDEAIDRILERAAEEI